MATIRLTHIDGKLPNLALMKLAHWHRTQGDTVHLSRTPSPSLLEPKYDMAYASAIFRSSLPVVNRFQAAFPDGLVGGTGTLTLDTVEDAVIGQEWENYDYSIYPDFRYSIGFTQRGCRLKCGFCVVPQKEGKPKAVNSIWDIWREGQPRAVHLLDNDFFGQPREDWRARVDELIQGRFRVSFSQGINIRMITEETASAIASVRYRDASLQRKRIYTAWDNLGDEQRFFKGLDLLLQAGVKPDEVMVYMLVGYNPKETMKDVFYRFEQLVNAGCRPFPMVYERENKPELRRFAKWVIRRFYKHSTYEEFRAFTTRRQPGPEQQALPMEHLHGR